MTKNEVEAIIFEDFGKLTETELLLLVNVIYDEREQLLEKRDRTIINQGKKIANLKKLKGPVPSNGEYYRLIERYKMSEKEFQIRELDHLEEIEELKNEISELLEIVSKDER